MQIDSERMHNLQGGVESRIAFPGQGFVKAFPQQACIPPSRFLCLLLFHPLRSGNVHVVADQFWYFYYQMEPTEKIAAILAVELGLKPRRARWAFRWWKC